jgi:hypothetical protein
MTVAFARPATYSVPKRFGMAGILAIMTFMAGLFGLLRACGAHPLIYVFCGVLSLVTCLVQMRYGEVPRMASVLAGAATLPACMIGVSLMLLLVDSRFRRFDLTAMACTLPLQALVGAGCGYLAGACTAGLFLLMDLIEPYLPGGTGQLRYAHPAPVPTEPVMAEIVEPPIAQADKAD